MLRRILLSVASVVMVGSVAQAADLPAYETLPPAPSFTWTGAYLGVQAGYGWGDSKFKGLGASVKTSPDGLIVGGYAGYNFQFDNSPVVVGVETDFNFADIDEKKNIFGGISGKTSTDWTGATRARLGYAFDRVLVYAAGGVAYADRELKVNGIDKDSKTSLGWTVGGGVESAITDNFTARVEYRYTDYGSDKFKIAGVSAKGDSTEHRVLAGVAYKFGW